MWQAGRRPAPPRRKWDRGCGRGSAARLLRRGSRHPCGNRHPKALAGDRAGAAAGAAPPGEGAAHGAGVRGRVLQALARPPQMWRLPARSPQAPRVPLSPPRALQGSVPLAWWLSALPPRPGSRFPARRRRRRGTAEIDDIS